MKMLLTDWSEEWRGTESNELKPAIFDFDVKRHLELLILALGNGLEDSACIETDCGESLEVILGALVGVGGAERIEVDTRARRSRLYREGYEVLSQNGTNVIFVNPVPRAELFVDGGLKGYVAEFGK